MMYLVQICLAYQTTRRPEQCKFTAGRRVDLHNVDLARRRLRHKPRSRMSWKSACHCVPSQISNRKQTEATSPERLLVPLVVAAEGEGKPEERRSAQRQKILCMRGSDCREEKVIDVEIVIQRCPARNPGNETESEFAAILTPTVAFVCTLTNVLDLLLRQ